MKRNDIVLIIIFIVIGSLFAGMQMLHKKPGKEVVITIDGEVYQVLKLDVEQQVKNECKDGHYNLLKIHDLNFFLLNNHIHFYNIF